MSEDTIELPEEAFQDALFEDAQEERELTVTDRLRMLVHFRGRDDRRAFSELIGQPVLAETKLISYPVAGRYSLPDVAHAEAATQQPHLFEVDHPWKSDWRGMPAYAQQDLTPAQTIEVRLADLSARAAFARLVDHSISERTKAIWFPPEEVDRVINLRWKSTRPQNPQYPVYVPTKGRWDSAFTIKCMERLGVPYFAVVQPQEVEHYKAVVKTGEIILLPQGLDGLVPTRNWIFEHAVASGARRHWQLDDNIKSFFRYHENRQIHVADATCMRIAEDFTDRYENVAISGFQYFMFVPRKHHDFPPYVFNTRVYSNSLINNSMPYRYRDIYNDDTDICLRALKDGWCTVQFNAFLAWKQPTMQVKGGNTPIYLGAEQVERDWVAHAKVCKKCSPDVSPTTCEEGKAILQRDGRWRMAVSLLRQHPDVTTVVRKWNRWQHHVDYRRFKGNVPVARPDLVLPQGQDDYGLELVEVAPTEATIGEPPREAEELVDRRTRARTGAAPAPAAPGPSALDFLKRAAQRPPAPAVEPARAPEPTGQGKALPPAPEPVQAQPEQSARVPAPEEEPENVSYAKALIEGLGARGIRLARQGKQLAFLGEVASVMPYDQAAVDQLRTELLALVKEGSDETDRVPEPATTHDLSAGLPAVAPLGGSQAADALPDAVPFLPAMGDLEATLFEEPSKAVNLAQLLGAEPPRVVPGWVPDEPPDLRALGVKEVVLNFATSGLDWRAGARPGGVTVSTLDGKLTRFLPFAFQHGGNLSEEVVKRWATEQLPGLKIYGSNVRFDAHQSRGWGVDLDELGCSFSDIQHTAALLDDHRKRFALDILAHDYLPDLQQVARLDETQHLNHHASEAAAREHQTAELVWRLKDVLYPELVKQELMEIQQLEDSVIPAVVEMEKNGSPLDLELLDTYHREVHAEHKRLLLEISHEVGFAFEHTTAGWQKLLNHLGLPLLDGYAEEDLDEVNHPLVRKGQLASQHASLASKTFDAYKKSVIDGVLYYDINQLRGEKGGTVSGRFSIEYVQQVPNKDNHFKVFGDRWNPRRLFIVGEVEKATHSGWLPLYFEADAAQIEFRLFAHYANNPEILAAYAKDPKMSWHKITWEMIKRYKPDQLYTAQKSYNFARQYGAKQVKLAFMMGHINADEMSAIRASKDWDNPKLKTIKEIEAAFNKMLPEGDELLNRASHLAKPACDKFCRKHDRLHRLYPHRGFVRTLRGRRSRFPDSYKTYIGLNRVLQGTGADIMKLKSAELHRQRKHTGFLMRITNHDATLGDARLPETAQRVAQILNEQSYPELKVPILWECGTGPNWADVKKD